MNQRKEKVFVFVLDISFCFTFVYFYIKLSKAYSVGTFSSFAGPKQRGYHFFSGEIR